MELSLVPAVEAVSSPTPTAATGCTSRLDPANSVGRVHDRNARVVTAGDTKSSRGKLGTVCGAFRLERGDSELADDGRVVAKAAH
jgi:hypothetical protein